MPTSIRRFSASGVRWLCPDPIWTFWRGTAGDTRFSTANAKLVLSYRWTAVQFNRIGLEKGDSGLCV